ncbi:MAG: hypothetical protein ACI9YH_000995 [Colwellia sp.]|jgi:hypothetical protein
MNYAEIIKSSTNLSALVNRSQSVFKEPLHNMISDAIGWVSREPSFLGDDEIDCSLKYFTNVSAAEFHDELIQYKCNVDILVKDCLTKEGNLINQSTTDLLEHEYITALTAAMCVIKFGCDMLNNNDSEPMLFASISAVSAQVLWLDVILQTMLYSEWRFDREKLGRKPESVINQYAQTVSQRIWQKYDCVSAPLATEVALTYAQKILNDFEDYGCLQFKSTGLYSVVESYDLNYANRYKDKDDFEEQAEKRLDKLLGCGKWLPLHNAFRYNFVTPINLSLESKNVTDAESKKQIINKKRAIEKHISRANKGLTLNIDRKFALAMLKRDFYIEQDPVTKLLSIEDGFVLCENKACGCHSKRKTA